MIYLFKKIVGSYFLILLIFFIGGGYFTNTLLYAKSKDENENTLASVQSTDLFTKSSQSKDKEIDSPSASKKSSEKKGRLGGFGTYFHHQLPRVFRWKDESSWQMNRKDIYLSLWDASYAINDIVSIHTLTVPWLTALIDTSAGANFGIRASLWSGRTWSIGTSLSYLRLNLQTLMQATQESESEGSQETIPNSSLNFIPWELYASWQISDSWLIGSSFKFNYIQLSGDDENTQTTLGLGSSNLHLRFHLAWAMGTHWSLWYIHNRLLYQSIGGQGYLNQSLEGNGSLEVWFSHKQSIDIKDYFSHGIRLVRRGELVILSFGFDWRKPPLYIIGNVIDSSTTFPYFNLGFIF